MAYKGLALVMYAMESEDTEGVPSYKDGGTIGRIMEYNLEPKFVDVSDYNDMNELDPEYEFAYAELTLKTAEVVSNAHMMALGASYYVGNIMSSDSRGHVTFKDIDRHRPIGIGLVRAERIKGTTRWTVTWLYKVKIETVKENGETRGKDINYNTPEIKARAYTPGSGGWKRDVWFSTKEDAVTYLQRVVAGTASIT